MKTKIIYLDFDFNLEKIKKITNNFNFCFKYYFPYITCVNLVCFEEHINDANALEKIKKLKLDARENLLIFYGKLWETYNGDDHVRFLKGNDLNICFWADNPYRIKLSLQQKNLISL